MGRNITTYWKRNRGWNLIVEGRSYAQSYGYFKEKYCNQFKHSAMKITRIAKVMKKFGLILIVILATF
jgi:hypothetical protein